jgi:propionyl-CoA carboxylase alpha chain
MAKEIKLPQLGQTMEEGTIVNCLVKVGDEVKVGEELAVLEAMKMENTLRAERNGTVAKIHFEPVASLEVGDTIMEFE